MLNNTLRNDNLAERFIEAAALVKEIPYARVGELAGELDVSEGTKRVVAVGALSAMTIGASIGVASMSGNETYQTPTSVEAQASHAMDIIKARQVTSTTSTPATVTKPLTDKQIIKSYAVSKYATGMANHEVPAAVVLVSEIPDGTTPDELALIAKQLDPNIDSKDLAKGLQVVNPDLIASGPEGLTQPIAKKEGEVLVSAGLTAPAMENLKARLLEFKNTPPAPGPVASEIPGLVSPANIEQRQNGYYLMNAAPNGEYEFADDNPDVHCGSKAIIDINYTVAQEWNKENPDSKIVIGDINNGLGDHLSHKKGVDSDITTSDKSAANMYTGSKEKNIELAQMYLKTGKVKKIFFSDREVIAEVNAWAVENGLTPAMEYWDGHETHFHIRANDEYLLPESNNCPAPLPPPAPAQALAPAPEVVANPNQPFSVNTNMLSVSGLTANQIDAFNAKHAPAFVGLGKVLIKMEQMYGINAFENLVHANIESTSGTSAIARVKHNIYGRNAYDRNPMKYATNYRSFADCIEETSDFLNFYYLTPPGGKPANSAIQPGWNHLDRPGMYYGGNTSIGAVFHKGGYSTAAGSEAELIVNNMNRDWAEISSLPK